MPYISIECGPLTAPQKQALIEQVTLAAAKATAIQQQFFMVTVKELPDTSFGIGGGPHHPHHAEYKKKKVAFFTLRL